MKKAFTSELLSGRKQNALEVPFDPAAEWNTQAVSLWRGRRGFRVKPGSEAMRSRAASYRGNESTSY